MNERTGAKRPIRIPSTTPTTEAKARPVIARSMLTAQWPSSAPVTKTPVNIRTTTLLKVGRKNGPIRPDRVTASQSAAKMASGYKRSSAAAPRENARARAPERAAPERRPGCPGIAVRLAMQRGTPPGIAGEIPFPASCGPAC